ncbi:copper ion binding protein [Neobacillus drentensis]|uniref:copper ion binding protein n=1 Tax=Neobacillus drentensis TaxID=220684 RepID=UPI002FFF036F
MEKTTLKVNGMSCGHCLKAIEGRVGELTGVESVKVDVEFNPSDVSVNKIKETIEDQGYDVE